MRSASSLHTVPTYSIHTTHKPQKPSRDAVLTPPSLGNRVETIEIPCCLLLREESVGYRGAKRFEALERRFEILHLLAGWLSTALPVCRWLVKDAKPPPRARHGSINL